MKNRFQNRFIALPAFSFHLVNVTDADFFVWSIMEIMEINANLPKNIIENAAKAANN